MKFSAIIALSAGIASARAVAIVERGATGPTDAQVLNFALTLEHLELAFYKQGLAKYPAGAFRKAGYTAWTRDRVKQIAAHEKTHVDFLTTALTAAGAAPVAACTYRFPDTDPKNFIALAEALESVGTSAYAGAAQFIQSKAYLTAAAQVLTTEGRHAGWISSAVQKTNPWGTAFEIPLTVNQVYTIASNFIVSCPETNQLLPVIASPQLAFGVRPRPGKITTVNFTPATPINGGLWAAFLTGEGTIFVKLNGRKVTVPEGLIGLNYVVITNSGTEVTDATTIAGPTILNFPFNSKGKLVY